MAGPLQRVDCPCGKFLFRTDHGTSAIEAKCPRCSRTLLVKAGTVTEIGPATRAGR